MTVPTAARDLGLLVARVVLGVVFVAHGWQKLTEWGLSGTTDSFQQMGVPAPAASAAFAAGVETVGGVLLVLGLALPLAGALLALNMLGALVFVHAGNGVFVAGGGWELVAVLGALSLALAVAGGGRFGLDHLVAARLRARRGVRRPVAA